MKLHQIIVESDKLSSFSPPTKKETGYNDQSDWSGGTNPVKWDGREWFFTGKAGKKFKNKKQAFEYKNTEDGDARIWVDIDGEVERD